MKKKRLDDLSMAIEAVVKTLRGSTAAPTKKRMPLDEFVSYALTQIKQAAKDKPAVAKRRLSALKRSVDGAIASIAKMAAEDTDSESIKVDVETAFAPTGDKPMDLTTASDQSSTEVSVTGIAAPAGDSGFAENLNAVAKALKKLKADLEPVDGGKPRKPAHKADRSREDRGEPDSAGEPNGGDAGDGWPMDLNTEAFLQGDTGTETPLTWGADPAGLTAAKPR